MTKTMKLMMGLVLIAGLTSCGVNKAMIFNQNQNATQVHLKSNNFKVVGKAKGTSDVDYVLIFGGANKKNLYDAAYADMLEQANLDAGPRAVVNVLTEEQVGGVPPFYYTRTVTVTANVIEFID